MRVSGAEAVIAASSPFVGLGESACLVKPYVDIMTDSEIHLAMTSGFSTIAGSVLLAYISLGVPAQNLITSSVMSIPASIAVSKMRYPETEEPVTRGHVAVDRGESGPDAPANSLHAFSQGAIFGLVVAGLVLANVLTILSLIAAINGLLTWIGKGFAIHNLTIQLVLGYVFYPVTFFLGVPRGEIVRVSRLLATKLVANEFSAYTNLHAIMTGDDPLSYRAWVIAQYALCGFANLGSVGIQIGVLSALAPSKAKIISRIALSAMICGFITCVPSCCSFPTFSSPDGTLQDYANCRYCRYARLKADSEDSFQIFSLGTIDEGHLVIPIDISRTTYYVCTFFFGRMASLRA